MDLVPDPGLWGLIPAGGSGRRMDSDVPKQYIEVAGRSILEWSYRALCADPRVTRVAVVVDDSDERWLKIAGRLERLAGTALPGAERCHSVMSGLEFLSTMASPEDWVLVHDAARPCLRREELARLIDSVLATGCGGLLATPLADTLKRADRDGRVQETVARELLWRALTPQMFRIGELRAALSAAMDAGQVVTDESSAMELAGVRPLLVAGRAGNIKVTRREDLALARWQLENPEEQD